MNASSPPDAGARRSAVAPIRLATLALLACLGSLDCHARAAPDRGADGAVGARVVRVIDGDTIDVALDGGGTRRVRLIGVDAPELDRDDPAAAMLGRRSAEHLRSLVAGRRVRLVDDPLGDTIDAYGRRLALVELEDGTVVNLRMIADGFARALTRFEFAELARFRRAEASAVAAGRGLWADEGPAPLLSTAEASAHVGHRATVCGRVASARHLRRARGGPTFLNLDRPYPDQLFTVVIWGDDRPLFDRPERRLDGERICVTGRIGRHRGVPQIVLRDPGQLAVGGDD